MPETKKDADKKKRLPDDEFVIWLTAKRLNQSDLKQAAAIDNIPLAEFARRALYEKAEAKLGRKLPRD